MSLVLFANLLSLTFIIAGNKNVAEDTRQRGFVELVEADLDLFRNVNYFKDKEVSIPISNDKALNISWGFSGSGDILTPFPRLDIRVYSVGDKIEQKEDFFSWKKMLALIFKNKAKKKTEYFVDEYLKDLGIAGWLANAKDSVIPTFILKLYCLDNYSFDGQEIRKKVEFFRLLFRLFSSGVVKVSDSSSPFPEAIKNLLKDFISNDLLNFIDDVWIGLGKGFKQYQFAENGSYNNGVKVQGFIFNNKGLARECFEQSKAVGFISEEEMQNKLVNRHRLDRECYSKLIDLEKFLDTTSSNYKFVSYVDFARINKDSTVSDDVKAYLPKQIKNAALVDRDSNIVLVEVSEKESFLLNISDKLIAFEAAKLSIVSLLKAFEEYREIRVNDNLGLEKVEFIELTDKELKELDELLKKQKLFLQKIAHLKSRKDKQEYYLEELTNDYNKFGDDLSKSLMNDAKKELSILNNNVVIFDNELNDIIKKLRILEIKSNSVIDIPEDDKVFGKNIVNLLLNVFIGSPEFKGMINAFNGNDDRYIDVKKNLLKRLTYVLKNSEDLEENAEMYKYLVEIFFPEFKDDFEKLVEKDRRDGFFDMALNFLGIN